MSLSQLAYAYLLWQLPISIAALVVECFARRGTQLWQLRLARGIWALALLAFPLCYLGRYLNPRQWNPEAIVEPRGMAQIVETQLPEYISTAIQPMPQVSLGSSFNGLELLACLIALLSALRALRVLRSEFALRDIYRNAELYRVFPGLDVRVSSVLSAPVATMVNFKRVVILDQETAAQPELVRIALVHEIQHHRNQDPRFAKILAWASALYVVNPMTWRLPANFELMEEQACDERVIARSWVDKKAYCRMLLEIAKKNLQASPKMTYLTTRGLTRKKSMLHTRIESMMKTNKKYPRRTALIGAGLGTLAIAASSWKLGRWSAQAAPLVANLGKYLNTSEPYGFFLPDSLALREVIHQKLSSPRFRSYIQKALDNYPEHGPYVEKQLAARGLPAGLLAVPMLESALDSQVGNEPRPPELDLEYSKGLWQFIPSTARSYGLVVTTELDERTDVVKSTAAALDLLTDLHQEFGDWPLAIAAYNVGPEKVKSAIQAGQSRDLAELVTKGLINRYGLVVLAEMVIVNHQELFAAER